MKNYTMRLRNVNVGRKGQAAVTDLFVAIGVFIVLITITSVMWNLYNIRLQNRIIYDDLVVKSFQINDLLLKTPGFPDNWDYLFLSDRILTEEIYYIGLVEGELNIPFNKTLALSKMGEENITSVFHAGQYRMGIRIRDADGEDLYSVGKVSGSSKYSVNLGRNVMYQNVPDGSFTPSSIEVILSR
ncbi:MAG: hypothetical protein Q8Q42_03205 [Nanoarchaeota archaeon]|nr:hypothetical protein [Nanoarchaeota archaeon]